MAYNPENINNISDNTSEVVEKGKENNNLRKMLIALGLVASIAVSFGGCGEDKPGAPSEAGPAYEYEEFQPDSPICISVTEMGQDKFVEKYGSYYDNPVLAYESLVSYEFLSDGESIFINPDYVKLFNSSDRPEEILGSNSYDLGFDSFKMPLDIDMTEDYSEKLFNDYTIKQIDRCINMIACNPDAGDLIRSEITSQFPNNPLDKGNLASQSVERFYDDLKSIVDENGYFLHYAPQLASRTDRTGSSTSLSTPLGIDGDTARGFEMASNIVMDVQDRSQLDEDGAALSKNVLVPNRLFAYFRIPVSKNSDGSILYSEEAMPGF